MPIQRTPSPLFAAVWAGWLGLVYLALALNERPFVGLAVLLAFFAIEIPATLLVMPGNARDTLSEIATWVQAKTSKHKRFVRGWNAAFVGGLILPVAWLLMRTVEHYADSRLLGVAMGALCVVFLWDHFSGTVEHG